MLFEEILYDDNGPRLMQPHEKRAWRAAEDYRNQIKLGGYDKTTYAQTLTIFFTRRIMTDPSYREKSHTEKIEEALREYSIKSKKPVETLKDLGDVIYRKLIRLSEKDITRMRRKLKTMFDESVNVIEHGPIAEKDDVKIVPIVEKPETPPPEPETPKAAEEPAYESKDDELQF